MQPPSRHGTHKSWPATGHSARARRPCWSPLQCGFALDLRVRRMTTHWQQPMPMPDCPAWPVMWKTRQPNLLRRRLARSVMVWARALPKQRPKSNPTPMPPTRVIYPVPAVTACIAPRLMPARAVTVGDTPYPKTVADCDPATWLSHPRKRGWLLAGRLSIIQPLRGVSNTVTAGGVPTNFSTSALAVCPQLPCASLDVPRSGVRMFTLP